MKPALGSRLNEVDWKLPDSAIARAFGYTQSAVLYHRKKLGIPKSQINPQASGVEPLLDRIDWSETDITLARRFGLKPDQLFHFRKKNNLPKATKPTIRKSSEGYANRAVMSEPERIAHDKALKAKCDRRYREAHMEAQKAKSKCYRETHGDEIRLKSKARYEANKETVLAKQKEYYEANKVEILKRNREHVLTIPIERRRKYSRDYMRRVYARDGFLKWTKENPEKRREIARNYTRKLLATPKGRLNHRMSSAMRCALQMAKGGRSWEALVGYTIEDLQRHIESKFQPGMNWDRLMGGQIHIDHIIPKSKFNYSKPEDPEFRKCWALENLRPMWARKNLSKGNKILEPSQIPLGI